MKRAYLLRAVTVSIASTVVAAVVLAQERTEPSRIDAADAAASIRIDAGRTTIDARTGSPNGEQKMQRFVDEIASLAGDLEADLDAGKGRIDTRETYRQLRRARLQALEFLQLGGLHVSAGDIAMFEASMAQLEKYYGE